MQISKSYVETCKFKSRYFGNSIILLLQKKLLIQNVSAASRWSGEFFEFKICRKHLKSWSKIEKPSIEDQIVQKWLLATFAILTVDVSNENYYC